MRQDKGRPPTRVGFVQTSQWKRRGQDYQRCRGPNLFLFLFFSSTGIKLGPSTQPFLSFAGWLAGFLRQGHPVRSSWPPPHGNSPASTSQSARLQCCGPCCPVKLATGNFLHSLLNFGFPCYKPSARTQLFVPWLPAHTHPVLSLTLAQRNLPNACQAGTRAAGISPWSCLELY